jgi:Tol biopolymer transport system component
LTLLVCLVAGAQATSLPERTFDVAEISAVPTGEVHDLISPSLSPDGSVAAFSADDAQAGGNQEVYSADTFTGANNLVSITPAGVAANGSSTAPSLSGDGSTIAFQSSATNLVAGVSIARDNVYVRLPDGAIELVSATPDGAEPNGASTQPVLSGNGVFVAYTSTATNLITGAVSAHSQVYVTDVYTRKTRLVSVAENGRPGDGWASNPAINSDGKDVTFDSASRDLVSTRVNAPQVYLRALDRNRTALISVTSGGRPQNRAVAPPFRQISSISANGEMVAFDSNADNLVLGDTNKSTDVFVRDLKDSTTNLVSVNNAGYEGDSDSFAPSISADGTKVAFESFASNLARGGGPAENVFVRDLTLNATTVVDVGPDGQSPGREQVPELLQRPAISSDGWSVAFESSAPGLTAQHSRNVRLFLRMLDPPIATFTRPAPTSVTGSSVTLHYRGDDPDARSFLCQVDSQEPFTCGARQVTFSGLAPGPHVLSVRAGGTGMLYQLIGLTDRVEVSR